jgi:hypothetical protein
MADALLSDIDGTLVDNNALHAEACRQIGKGGDQVAKASKPEADSFAAALEKVMMRAGQAVALGDAPWDAQAGHTSHRSHFGRLESGRSPPGVWKSGWIRQTSCSTSPGPPCAAEATCPSFFAPVIFRKRENLLNWRDEESSGPEYTSVGTVSTYCTGSTSLPLSLGDNGSCHLYNCAIS